MSAPKKISEYAIGEEMWRFQEGGGTLQYKVIGVRTYEDGPQLEVEATGCNHGWKCRVLVAQNDYGKIVAVHMLNDDEEDSQRHWHGNEGGTHFWPTRAEAREEGLRMIVRRVKDRIRVKQESLDGERKYLKQLEDAIDDAALSQPATQQGNVDG